MSKTFRAWKIDEPLFLPPMVGDFVAKDLLARFVLSLVRDDLGLGENRTCHPAILGHRGRRLATTQPGVSKPGRSTAISAACALISAISYPRVGSLGDSGFMNP